MKNIENLKENEIVINGETYVKKDSINLLNNAEKVDGMEYCIVRTYSAGVFAGYVEKMKGKDAIIRNSRRIWYWSGANSLSDLATHGTTERAKCKFSCVVDKTILTEVIEVITITEKAKQSIAEVPEWTKK